MDSHTRTRHGTPPAARGNYYSPSFRFRWNHWKFSIDRSIDTWTMNIILSFSNGQGRAGRCREARDQGPDHWPPWVWLSKQLRREENRGQLIHSKELHLQIQGMLCYGSCWTVIKIKWLSSRQRRTHQTSGRLMEDLVSKFELSWMKLLILLQTINSM